MKTAVIQSWGLDHLVVTERDTPSVGAEEVRVKIAFASLNYRDLLMAQGMYNPRQKLPLIPCSDGAGVVDAVGSAVTRWRVGDRVMGTFAQGWLSGEIAREKVQHSTLGGPLDGMLCEQRVLHQEGLVAVPEHLSLAEAATLPCAGVTAWRAIVDHGGILPGQWVLVQGSGGVSVFALQFAKLFHARVIATTSSDEKAEKLRALGADVVINYKTTPDWAKPAREATGGRGVDVIVEVGGAGTMEQSLRAVKMGGRVCVIGVLAGPAGPISLLPVLMQDVRLQGVIVGSREHFVQMTQAIAAAKLAPVVESKRFALEQVREAFAFMASGAHFGKIVVQVS
jgi:NADPH:quinone reductase-like Zn-dependent oxidoreductase